MSDSFDICHEERTEQFKNKDHEYFFDPEAFDGADGEEYAEAIAQPRPTGKTMIAFANSGGEAKAKTTCYQNG